MTTQQLQVNHNPFHLRSMLPQDLPSVMAIETAVHAYPWSENQMRASIDSAHLCWVMADEQSSIVAYAVVSCVLDEAELLNIAVAPKHQRCGIGLALLEFVCGSLSSKTRQLFLEVRQSNRAAIALYHQLGFNEVGVRAGYYPADTGREDALILAKDFCSPF